MSKIIATIIVFFTETVSAQNKYIPLSGAGAEKILPGMEGGDINAMLQGFYKWGVGIAVLIALVYIVIGGIQYMTTDAIYDKGEGRKKIYNAFFGLLIAMSSYLILNTINPDIVRTELKFGKLGTTPVAQKPLKNTYGDVVVPVNSGLAAQNTSKKFLTELNNKRLNAINETLSQNGFQIQVEQADTQGGNGAYITIKNKESLTPAEIKKIIAVARQNGFESTTYTMPVSKIPDIYRQQLVDEGIPWSTIMGGSIDRPYEHFHFSTKTRTE